MSNQVTLIALLKKANFQLIDAVHAHLNGDMAFDEAVIKDTLSALPENQQAKATVVFLFNLAKHKAMFEAIVESSKLTVTKKDELSADEIYKAAIGKAITVFKALNKLVGVVTPEQATAFLTVSE